MAGGGIPEPAAGFLPAAGEDMLTPAKRTIYSSIVEWHVSRFTCTEKSVQMYGSNQYKKTLGDTPNTPLATRSYIKYKKGKRIKKTLKTIDFTGFNCIFETLFYCTNRTI